MLCRVSEQTMRKPLMRHYSTHQNDSYPLCYKSQNGSKSKNTPFHDRNLSSQLAPYLTDGTFCPSRDEIYVSVTYIPDTCRILLPLPPQLPWPLPPLTNCPRCNLEERFPRTNLAGNGSEFFVN